MKTARFADGFSVKNTSPTVRPVEEVREEMLTWGDSVLNCRQRMEDYKSGWDDDFDDPVVGVKLEQELKTAEDNYERVKEEYENHPDYYRDRYRNASGFEKAVKGTVNSAIATVPVIWETVKSDLEAHKAYHEDNPTTPNYFDVDPSSDTQTEKETRYFDVDPADWEPSEPLPGLKKYQKPVSMDENGMELMEEAVWLKNDATKNLNGFWKSAADTAIDVGQDAIWLPALALGPGAYVAGTAANSAAEEMYAQTAEGKTASDAIKSGLLTAGVEAAMEGVSNLKIPADKFLKEVGISGNAFVKKFLENANLAVTKSTIDYFLVFLANKVGCDPDATFSVQELIQNAVANGFTDFLARKTNALSNEFDIFWDES